MNEILKKTKIKTKKEAVDSALKEYLRKIRLKELSDLAGKIAWSGDLETMRKD